MAGVCEGECMGRSQGNETLTLTRCHSCGMQQLYEAFVGWKSVLWPSLKLKGFKGEIFYFSSFLSFVFFHCSSFLGMMRANPVVQEEVVI